MVVGTEKVGMKGRDIKQSWAIVLAGGDGTRLQGLTREIDGDARPKQFSRVFGDQSLLCHTRERLKPIFGDNRSMFVVTKKHQSFMQKS
jgi:mannose-1-phosphate guanylyltransferase